MKYKLSYCIIYIIGSLDIYYIQYHKLLIISNITKFVLLILLRPNYN